jgi:hypothetical protein
MHLLVLLLYIVYVCVVSYYVHRLVDMPLVTLCTAAIIQNLRDPMNLCLQPSALRPVVYRTLRRPAGKLFIFLFLDPRFVSAIVIVAVVRGLRKDVAAVIV